MTSNFIEKRIIYEFPDKSRDSRIFNSSLEMDESAIFPNLHECNIDRSNTLTFKIILMLGIVFVIISALISFYIDKVNRRILLGKQ